MGLAQYRKKRDFTRTPEPAGVIRSATKKKLRFVVQKHAATRLHYDFRLEMAGVLKSWAVPKGPSMDPGEKRLAVHVEDHPLDYGDFEGVIPQGEYGGGTVMVWDRGKYTCDEDPLRALERGSIRFHLFGEKLRGEFALVQMKGEAGGNGKNWLLIKGRDEEADEKADVLESEPLSAISGRDLDEIASGGNTWLSNRKKSGRASPQSSKKTSEERRAPVKSSRKIVARAKTSGAKSTRKSAKSKPRAMLSSLKELPGARPHGLPRSIHPELATLVSEVPNGDEWIHEIKFDGYRILARMENGSARLYSRNGLDWTERFEPIRTAVEDLPAASLILDGEVVAHAADGTASFEAMQRFLREGRRAGLVYYVFDLLHLDGYDVTAAPLVARKNVLADLLGSNEAHDGFVRFSEHHEGDGSQIFRQACEHHLEGLISKKRDSPYRPGRGRDWVKTKCSSRQEFVLGGYTEPEGARSGFGALLLGVYESPGRLVYAGRVGTGFNDALLHDLYRRMKKLEQTESPFVNPPTTAARRRGVHWIKPQLVAEVEFTEWTREGLLRHPSFQGIREDKKAAEVVREDERPKSNSNSPKEEQPKSNSETLKGKTSKGKASKRVSSRSGGPTLTNPDKVLYPEVGITKRDLASFYESIAERILPHLQDRPIMMKRCPEGQGKPCFYQKHLRDAAPDALRQVEIQEKTEKDFYTIVDDLAGLLWLVQMGVLEIHVWGSRARNLEQPDRLIFDIDPDVGLPWPRVMEAATTVRERLQSVGLESFLKTSGGKGLHVTVPVLPELDWDDAKTFCQLIAQSIADEEPERYTTVMSKKNRRGKIFLDYLRNARGATAIAPYSTRAHPLATVATPIHWEELTARMRPDQWTVKNLARRLRNETDDPWGDLDAMRQSIVGALKSIGAESHHGVLGRSTMPAKRSQTKTRRKYSKKASDTVESAVHRYKRGTLKSGKGGRGGKAKSRKQAIAIGLSEARKKGAKVPAKKKSRRSS